MYYPYITHIRIIFYTYDDFFQTPHVLPMRVHAGMAPTFVFEICAVITTRHMYASIYIYMCMHIYIYVYKYVQMYMYRNIN